MNLYRVDRLSSLLPKVELFAENERVCAEIAAWHLHGVSAIYCELAPAFVPHVGSVGWIARLRWPDCGIGIDLSIVLVIRDAQVHT